MICRPSRAPTSGALQFHPEWLRGRARRLRARVLSDSWRDDLRTFAHALTFGADGGVQPARVVASAAGHLLASRLLDGDDVASQREALMQRLFEPDLLGAAGIRTKSTRSARFSPGAYHNGSVRPMDCGVISDGLRRHGANSLADDLDGRILAACHVLGGFPEFVRGKLDNRIVINTDVVDGPESRLEQPPQLERGWTATRVWRILHSRQGTEKL